jgi:acetylornithine deacetylase/succinyl-diaminopimelate desuccinylase-like protein
MRSILSIIGILCIHLTSNCQPLAKIKDYSNNNHSSILHSFHDFLSIPNISADRENIALNARWIANYMKLNHISNVQLLNTNNLDAPPVVFGEVIVPGAQKTIIFYAHYDGQPVDSSKWLPGLHPFIPKLFSNAIEKGGLPIEWPKDGQQVDPLSRIYARGASDDKAGLMAIINGYASLLANNLKPAFNIKFFFEGEEEAGSPHLEEILLKNKHLLNSDLWVICDGPVHQSGKKQVVFGVRGDTHIELTVFGPKRPLHSGHYGNWAPNPAMELSKLLSSMKNDSGYVTIKGFYDDVVPLTNSEITALSKVPSVDDQLKKELGFRKSENSDPLNQTLNLPSLNINGIQSAAVGKLSANVIPTKAVASIDLRLVLGNDWRKQQDKIIEHIKSKGFFIVDREPTDEERGSYDKICMVKRSDGYNAQKTSLDNALAKSIVSAVKMVIGEAPILMPTLGGSLPLYVFEKVLKTNPITVPIANHDNNQHAENENIKLKNFWDGIVMFASIMLFTK